jgi:hypothetical protein
MVRRLRRRIARRGFLFTALTLAALAGVLLGTGQVSAAHPFGRHRGDCLRAAAGGMRTGHALDDLVADGTITTEQRDAIADELDRPLACRGLGDGAVSEAVSALFGMPRDEIRAAWLDGSSLADIAAEQGIDRAMLVETMTSALDARLTDAVNAGTISAERKTEIMSKATDRIEQAVDRHRGDRRDQPGSDDAPPSTTGLTATVA